MEDLELLLPPLSPRVRKVFEDFLQKAKSEPLIDKAAVKRLTSILLEKRKVDVESLRIALFGDDPETP